MTWVSPRRCIRGTFARGTKLAAATVVLGVTPVWPAPLWAEPLATAPANSQTHSGTTNSGTTVSGTTNSEPSPGQRPPRWHLFFGIDGAEHSMFGHSGFVWSPLGDLHHSGWRLRAAVNGGAFTYLSGGRDITGQLLSASVMPGFQWIGTDIGLTVYAGATVQDQTTSPYDPGKLRQGTRFGGKVLAEGWLRPMEGVFLNLSGSYASAVETYSTRLSANIEVSPRFALEPEIAAFGEPGYDQQRFGLLVEYRYRPGLQFKFGGGWAIDPDDDGPYAAIQIKAWH